MISEFVIGEEVISGGVPAAPSGPPVGFKPFLEFMTDADVVSDEFMTDADVAVTANLTGIT